MRPLRYFSCFSGIGGSELAIKKVFPNSICVGYSEIDPVALEVYTAHFPTHRNYGDISKIKVSDFPECDLILGGSPCQGFSSHNQNGKGWDDKRSRLLLKFITLIKKTGTPYFLLENVSSMSNDIRDKISDLLDCDPVFIKSAQFTPQDRNRFYWANFDISPVPERFDGGNLGDILVPRFKAPKLELTIQGESIYKVLPHSKRVYALRHMTDHHYSPRNDQKSNPVLTTQSLSSLVRDGHQFRYLLPIELERLQGFPDDWTSLLVYKGKRQKCIGNAFTVPVIVFILKSLKRAIK